MPQKGTQLFYKRKVKNDENKKKKSLNNEEDKMRGCQQKETTQGVSYILKTP